MKPTTLTLKLHKAAQWARDRRTNKVFGNFMSPFENSGVCIGFLPVRTRFALRSIPGVSLASIPRTHRWAWGLVDQALSKTLTASMEEVVLLFTFLVFPWTA